MMLHGVHSASKDYIDRPRCNFGESRARCPGPVDNIYRQPDTNWLCANFAEAHKHCKCSQYLATFCSFAVRRTVRGPYRRQLSRKSQLPGKGSSICEHSERCRSTLSRHVCHRIAYTTKYFESSRSQTSCGEFARQAESPSSDVPVEVRPRLPSQSSTGSCRGASAPSCCRN